MVCADTIAVWIFTSVYCYVNGTFSVVDVRLIVTVSLSNC